MSETRTYTSRGYALRAARTALKDKHPDAMSGVHFRIEGSGDEWTWAEIDLQSGEVVGADAVDEAPGFMELPANAVVETAPAETREQRRLRKIAEADARNAAKAKGEPAPKAKAEPKAPKAAGGVATKVAELVRLVQTPEGLTETQLKEITGWSKFGGFYAAVKSAGLTMTRTKVEGVNVWKVAA